MEMLLVSTLLDFKNTGNIHNNAWHKVREVIPYMPAPLVSAIGRESVDECKMRESGLVINLLTLALVPVLA